MIATQPGDTYFGHADTITGLGIRIVEDHWRGPATHHAVTNHVGVIVEPDVCVEALTCGIVKHSFSGNYKDSGQWIAIYRPRRLTPAQISAVCAKAQTFMGDSYGYEHIVEQLLGVPWLNSGLGNRPICSVLVGAAFDAAPYYFGTPFGALNPENIWDHVNAYSYAWECVRPLGPWD